MRAIDELAGGASRGIELGCGAVHNLKAEARGVQCQAFDGFLSEHARGTRNGQIVGR